MRSAVGAGACFLLLLQLQLAQRFLGCLRVERLWVLLPKQRSNHLC